MKLVNLGLAGVLGSFSVIASSMTAQALDYNFSFYGDQGSKQGLVEGIIRGVSDTGAMNNAFLEVYKSPFSESINKIYSYSSGNGTIQQNFNSSYLSASVFFSRDDGETIGGVLLGPENLQDVYTRSTGTYLKTVTTSPVTLTALTAQGSATAVPFDFNPAEGAALGVPLFIGLGVLRKRVARKSTASKAVVAVK